MVKNLKSHSGKNGIKQKLSYNIFVIAAFLLPAFIVAVCFVINKVEPFGRNIVMVSDAWHQYYPFLRELQCMLKEGQLPLYSWNVGGGTNFLGVIANYLASPLNLLTVFLPEGHVWLESYLAFTIVIRIGCAGGFMAVFLRKAFRRNDFSLVYFSLMYALCGFIMGYYWNVMWLDSVALLPLVAAGVISVLKDGKYSLYIISLAFCIICNFYIGFVVCIFVLLFSICYTAVNFKGFCHSMKNAGKMAGFTLIAFMLTAFMTVPAYFALSKSDSMSDVSGFPIEYSITGAYGYTDASFGNTMLAIVRTVTNLLSYTRPISMDKGEPNIFCSTLAVVLCVFYFVSDKIKLKEKIVSLSFLVIFILSFVINQLSFIWHGFNDVAMVYYRFSFLFSFVLVAMAYRAFSFMDTFGKKAFLVSSVILSVYLVAAVFVQKTISVIITAAVIIIIMFLLFLYKKGKLKHRILSVSLCLLVICDMSVSALYSTRFVGYYTGEDYPNQVTSVNKLISIAENNSGESELYRTEFVRPYSYNDGALYSVFGISAFNSMCREDYADFLSEFGLEASKKNNMYLYVESTPVTNLFLNIKYLIARADGTVDPEDVPVHICEEVMDSRYMSLVSEEEGSRLYENKAFLPVGFMTKTSLLDYELYESSRLPQDTQNEFFSLATGIDKDVLVSVEASKISGADLSAMKHYERLGNYYTYQRTATEDEVLTVQYVAPEDGSYYGIFRNSSKEKFAINCGGRTVWDLDNDIHITALGTCRKGDTISVNLPVIESNNGRLGYYLFYLDEEVFEEGLDKLSQSTLKLSDKTACGLKGTINAKEDGLFYTSVLYDEGWKAYVDGKETEIKSVAKTFCAFELSEGEHEIELRFTPVGVYSGFFVTIAGVIVFALTGIISVLYRKKKR